MSVTSGAYGVIGGGKPTTGTKTGAGTGANAVTAHYAGYEAAVYAAASNYIQNKNQSRGTGNWKGGRGIKRRLKYRFVIDFVDIVLVGLRN